MKYHKITTTLWDTLINNNVEKLSLNQGCQVEPCILETMSIKQNLTSEMK